MIQFNSYFLIFIVWASGLVHVGLMNFRPSRVGPKYFQSYILSTQPMFNIGLFGPTNRVKLILTALVTVSDQILARYIKNIQSLKWLLVCLGIDLAIDL